MPALIRGPGVRPAALESRRSAALLQGSFRNPLAGAGLVAASSSAAPPRGLCLHEPAAALDLQHQHAMLALVRRCAMESGMGVITVLHDLNLALRHADDALVLQQGCACADGPAWQLIEPGPVQRVPQIWQVAGADSVPQLLLAA